MTATTSFPYALRDNDLILSEPGAAERQYVLRVRDLPLEEKPREKLLQNGPAALSNQELLAIILASGTKKEDVMSMTRRIVKEYGELTLMNETRPERLAAALDIPLIKASQVIASFELGRRFYAQRNGKPVYIKTAHQAFDYVKDMGGLHKEQLRGLYLDSQYHLIYEEVISIGSLTANIVHPREVFRPAIVHGAVAVIVAHNHPSGRLAATDADISVTHQLHSAGKILGIDLLDHLIIAGKKFVSVLD